MDSCTHGYPTGYNSEENYGITPGHLQLGIPHGAISTASCHPIQGLMQEQEQSSLMSLHCMDLWSEVQPWIFLDAF